MKINKIFLGLAVLAVMFNSCKNEDITFPDFDYQSVYFANQYPVRTVELGEDLFVDNSMDNQHKIEIKATTAGVYENKNNIVIDFRVENSLCDNLYFDNGRPILPMPASHYQLASPNKITISKGSLLGGIEVQLTDDFFADPSSIGNTYVIPLVMTGVQGADSILSGVPAVESPDRCVNDNWTIQPKDFVLYAVKFVNQYHGSYLRRGQDQITDLLDNSTSTSVRHQFDPSKDELVSISTNSLSVARLPLTILDRANKSFSFTLILTFAGDNTCTISGNTADYTISGTGKFVEKGDKNSFGGIDRNALYLDYAVEFSALKYRYATKDTLVVRDRGIAPEYFNVVRR
ncbi:MAG: DUF5627 domain-containing protein [Tannerella sp.]|nr:DUF5627 domain-containing protein [Tannerella sp.]